jgi:HK97 gp10 family phage protein
VTSVEIRLDVKGVEQFEAKMRSLDSAIQKHVHLKLVSLGADVAAEARRLAPMRTGRLRSSIFSRVREWMLVIGATAPYALFVEFGTRYMQARRFLWRAIQRYLPQLGSIMGEAISQAIEEAQRT